MPSWVRLHQQLVEPPTINAEILAIANEHNRHPCHKRQINNHQYLIQPDFRQNHQYFCFYGMCIRVSIIIVGQDLS